VPRLGGVALCGGAFAAAIVLYIDTRDASLLRWTLLSLPVFLVGLVDDLRPVSAKVRMALQLAVAVAYVALEGVPSSLTWLTAAPQYHADAVQTALHPALGYPLSVLWIVGLLNIYNFMDGMDGLASVQALGASVALAFLCAPAGPFAALAVCLFAASLGFFVHNAPKAKIFLGDAGSTVLGFTFATLSLRAARTGAPFYAGPVALAPFLLDATFTLIRRVRAGEKPWEAHRTHLYQRAVTTGLSHGAVLGRYAIWIAFAAVSAISLLGARLWGAVAAPISMLLTLVLVWRWVASREKTKR
jgi:UDP-N-acetylmuramyl pentapeptide phosphotransferase/UDP-N-acetylglucosamine-1-phosphate transferase